MDDAKAQAKKADLEARLSNVDPNIGVAFGEDLFRAFRDRGWITLEDFGILGTKFLNTKLPAYDRTHAVHVTWDLPDEGFEVGTPAD